MEDFTSVSRTLDITKHMYPHLEGAKILEYIGDDVPEELTVTFSNVVYRSDTDTESVLDDGGDAWGWHDGISFTGGFKSPHDAIDNYLEWRLPHNTTRRILGGRMSFDIQINHCKYCGCESDEPYCSKECWELDNPNRHEHEDYE